MPESVSPDFTLYVDVFAGFGFGFGFGLAGADGFFLLAFPSVKYSSFLSLMILLRSRSHYIPEDGRARCTDECQPGIRACYPVLNCLSHSVESIPHPLHWYRDSISYTDDERYTIRLSLLHVVAFH